MLATLIALAQQQPAGPTPMDLRPALYGVAGTLLGVALSTIVQLINARIQRRHENRGRAFDARFTTYSKFLAALDEWSDLTADVQAVIDEGNPEHPRLDTASTDLDRLGKYLTEASASIHILSDTPTREAIRTVIAAVQQRRPVTEAENDAIRVTIRRELGLDPA